MGCPDPNTTVFSLPPAAGGSHGIGGGPCGHVTSRPVALGGFPSSVPEVARGGCCGPGGFVVRTKGGLGDCCGSDGCLFSFSMAGLKAAQLVAAVSVGSALSFLQVLFYLWLASCCATKHAFEFGIPKQEALDCVCTSFASAGLEEAQLMAEAYVGSILLFLLVLFCWWSVSCCATYKIGHLLPGPQSRTHCSRH